MKDVSKRPYAWVPSLYLAEALPYVAVMVIATTMYKRLGLSNTDLALYTSWLYLPWVIKPFWSPFVAAFKTERWWVLTMQLLIGAGFAGIAFSLPTSFWLQGSLAFFWILAFASATHDIAADGLYILGLTTHDQSLYVGIRSTFYRIGNLLGQGLLVMLAGWLEKTQTIPLAWSITFLILAGLFLALWLWHGIALPKVDVPSRKPEGIVTDFWLALKTFFTKPHIVPALFFMLLFRFPEGQLVKIANPFLLDSVEAGGLALSTEAVGFVYGTIGIIGLTAGGLLGGWCVSRDGLKQWFWPMVLSISLPDLVYVYLASGSHPSLLMVNICVFIEQFGYGFGFTAYMLYLVYFSQGERSTAVFSICTAMQALGMMIPGMIAGWLADTLGYLNFFWWVALSCLVTFLVSSLIHIDPSYGRK
ncbi:MAG: MFS transporter [Bacteroidaceae bacterium]|nr:MFS transporter [Bacteroidaceae bacterium]